jgi:hypothetical protein
VHHDLHLFGDGAVRVSAVEETSMGEASTDRVCMIEDLEIPGASRGLEHAAAGTCTTTTTCTCAAAQCD